MSERESAGLPLSVGQASLPVRLVIACSFLLNALIIAMVVFAATTLVAKILVTLLVVPFAIVSLIATLFVIAPHSRFGDWLDHFVPRLRDSKTAFATLLTIWLAAALLMLAAESLH